MAGRVFLRGIEGEKYELRAQRQHRLQAPHVVHPEDRAWRDEKAIGHEDSSRASKAKWLVGPGDEPFLTQTLQCHFVRLDPGGSNGGHGHQNEAAFYILQGHGYEIHDDKRYEWKAGDLVVVHNDCRHQHFNASDSEPALALVFKAKALWMYLGLTQQGKRGTIPEDAAQEYGEREEWGAVWTPGLDRLRKIVRSEDEPWTDTRDGRVKWLAAKDMDVRLFSVDICLQEVSAQRTGPPHWHMADELYYVISGRGETLEWPVEAEIDSRYHARVRRSPRRQPWSAGDLVYIAQNTVHQLVAAEDSLLIGAQNRLFKLLGYDSVVYRDQPSEVETRSGDVTRA
ncbi:MAG TPA: cupin domain-containing protein [Candidatus Dormibacteraeota bacterium]|nr:cupin domain-containing protein [Candidatus Dormibacteraeota bacterium]